MCFSTNYPEAASAVMAKPRERRFTNGIYRQSLPFEIIGKKSRHANGGVPGGLVQLQGTAHAVNSGRDSQPDNKISSSG